MTSDAPETDRSHDLNVLLELLDVEQRDEDVFIGQHPEQKTARTFGGQLLGQGVVAATRTLTRGNPPVHALHAHFIRGGAVDKPMEYHVQRYRDGTGPISPPDPAKAQPLFIKLDASGNPVWSRLLVTPYFAFGNVDALGFTGDPSGGMVLLSNDPMLDLGSGAVLGGNVGLFLARFAP